MNLSPPNSNHPISEHIARWDEPLKASITSWLNSFGRPLDTIASWDMFTGPGTYKPQLNIVLHFNDGTACSKKFSLQGKGE